MTNINQLVFESLATKKEDMKKQMSKSMSRLTPYEKTYYTHDIVSTMPYLAPLEFAKARKKLNEDESVITDPMSVPQNLWKAGKWVYKQIPSSAKTFGGAALGGAAGTYALSKYPALKKKLKNLKKEYPVLDSQKRKN